MFEGVSTWLVIPMYPQLVSGFFHPVTVLTVDPITSPGYRYIPSYDSHVGDRRLAMIFLFSVRFCHYRYIFSKLTIAMKIHPPFQVERYYIFKWMVKSLLASYVCLLLIQVFIYLLVSIYLPIYLGGTTGFWAKKGRSSKNDHPQVGMWMNPCHLAWTKIHERKHHHLGGGFKYFLFSSLLGEMIQFD